MNIPRNQTEYENMFSTEDKCLSYLKELRYPEGYLCSKCYHTEYWFNKRNIMVCRSCKDELSITSGTFFHNSKLSLVVIFRALWWMLAQKNGVSASDLQKVLGVGSYRTAWTWLQKFRHLMVFPSKDKLSGKLELGETLIGGKNADNRCRGLDGKTLIVIAAEIKENGTGRVRMSIIPDASKKSFTKFTTENIEKGSTLITDGWKGYTGISKKGYLQIIKDETKIFDGEEVLPNIHKIATLLKRWLIGTPQNYIGEQYLSYYLDEYTFRYNTRNSKNRGLLFQKLIEQGVKRNSIEYKLLKSMRYEHATI